MTKPIAILGSTGSIGESTLDLCRKYPQYFRVVALSAGQNIQKLLAQIQEFQPELVSVQTPILAAELKTQITLPHVKVLSGEEGAVAVATHPKADVVVSAIVGAAGLVPTHAAIAAGKTIALANKESMIIAGPILSALAKKSGAKIIPVDSEHSAIFQCLNGEDLTSVQKLILTASGGPFLTTPAADFKNITKTQALKHPNWNMGNKITIDSATLMNKGLEVIEAQSLFGFSVEQIEVVVHPQSIIHSMVEFVDGSVMAQMGEPDMRGPIAYALSYPKRLASYEKKLDLSAREKLTFCKPDFAKFPCLKLAFEVAKKGMSYIPVLNAANEVVVEAFLKEQIAFTDIPRVIECVLSEHSAFTLTDLPAVLSLDLEARRQTQEMIRKIL